MIGEISIGGVYVPSLLLLVGAATIFTVLLTRLLSVVNFHRFVVYRPVTDIAFFLLSLACFVLLTEHWGLRA
jgi:Protein of unknown function (DUF1656)